METLLEHVLHLLQSRIHITVQIAFDYASVALHGDRLATRADLCDQLPHALLVTSCSMSAKEGLVGLLGGRDPELPVSD